MSQTYPDDEVLESNQLDHEVWMAEMLEGLEGNDTGGDDDEDLDENEDF